MKHPFASLLTLPSSRFCPVTLQVATLHSSATLPYDTLPVTLPVSSLSPFSDVLQTSRLAKSKHTYIVELYSFRHHLLTEDGVAVSALAIEELYKNFLKRLQVC